VTTLARPNSWDSWVGSLRTIAATFVEGKPPELPMVTLRRSFERIDLDDGAAANNLATLIAAWPQVLLPLPCCRAAIFEPAFLAMPVRHTAISAGLVVSIPSAPGARLGIGWAERRWRSDGALAAKIRVSAFFDDAGMLCWDFGVAGRNPPPISSLRAGVRAAAALARNFGARVDLTPSHQKAAWLAVRLGGRAQRHDDYLAMLRDKQWETAARHCLTLEQ
jgi:hypothetical protein